jgi:hypothetical protein
MFSYQAALLSYGLRRSIQCSFALATINLQSCLLLIRPSLSPFFPPPNRYTDLPVLIVREWEDATPELLRSTYKEFMARTDWAMDRLFMPYWRDYIRTVQNRSVEGALPHLQADRAALNAAPSSEQPPLEKGSGSIPFYSAYPASQVLSGALEYVLRKDPATKKYANMRFIDGNTARTPAATTNSAAAA